MKGEDHLLKNRGLVDSSLSLWWNLYSTNLLPETSTLKRGYVTLAEKPPGDCTLMALNLSSFQSEDTIIRRPD